MADVLNGRQADAVLLVSDDSGRLMLLDTDSGDAFAAARRMMRSWELPGGPADECTHYVNAGLHEVPSRMLPGLESMRQAGDVRTVLSARRQRMIESDFRTYNLTECVHPDEPGCTAEGGHDWTSDPRIDCGSSDGLKREHCRRPGCHITKQWADQCDRPDAYETDVSFVRYGRLDGAARAAHEDAYGVGSGVSDVDKVDKADNDNDGCASDDAGAAVGGTDEPSEVSPQ